MKPELEKFKYITRTVPRCQAITNDTDFALGSQCIRAGRHEFEGSLFCTQHYKKEYELWRTGRHHLYKKVTRDEFDEICKAAHKTIFDLASQQQEQEHE
jgi:hypothetical protein